MELGETPLTAVEVRVFGCLIEKQLATPQYYPLTLNALLNACNQSSNRDPVVAYDDRTVEEGLAGLREKGLSRVVHSVHNRATKYRHVLDEVFALEPPELAVLAVLLLRGPQTVGELRTRTDRMAAFEDLGAVDRTLDTLAGRPRPLVVRLARQPGQKEARVAHLLAGEVDASAFVAASTAPAAPATSDRIAAVEDEVRALRAEVGELREHVAELRGLIE